MTPNPISNSSGNANNQIEWPDGLSDSIDPWNDTNTTVEQCPTGIEPPNDPREQCVNGVELRFGICMQSGANPVFCHAARALSILMCQARPESD